MQNNNPSVALESCKIVQRLCSKNMVEMVQNVQQTEQIANLTLQTIGQFHKKNQNNHFVTDSLSQLYLLVGMIASNKKMVESQTPDLIIQTSIRNLQTELNQAKSQEDLKRLTGTIRLIVDFSRGFQQKINNPQQL